MAEEFQTEVCGWNWWNSSRNSFTACSSPCSAGSFGWGTEMLDIKTRSCDVFQDVQKPLQEDSASLLIDSSLQILGFGVSSPSSTATGWNQAFLEKGENNLNSVLGEDVNSRLNYRQENSSTEDFKPMNQDFSLEQQRLNPITSSSGFPIESASYGSPSTLIHSLFDTYPQSQPQQSLLNNRSRNNYCSMENYGTNSDDQLWNFPITSVPKQQPSSLHFSNNTPVWNASAAAQADIRHSFLPSSHSQIHDSTFEEKPRCTNFTTKVNKTEEVRDSKSMVKKSSIEPTFKRARIETPSLLPSFKVRKEKLGDRVTALQQLVSPFGKTDTASVLHEAIEYIKFLHDQASVLSTPYKKNGAPVQQKQQASDKFMKDAEGPKQDLKSRGLCLVPISITFPVVNETSAEFWTPTFGGTFS